MNFPIISAYHMKYTPPTVKHLAQLKDQLGGTGAQMANLFGMASDVQWRKYTGGAAPREISLQRAFFMSAMQVLTADEIERVRVHMASFGARWERDDDTNPPKPDGMQDGGAE